MRGHVNGLPPPECGHVDGLVAGGAMVHNRRRHRAVHATRAHAQQAAGKLQVAVLQEL